MNTYLQRMLLSLGLTIVLLAIGGWYFPEIPSSSMQSDFFWSNKVQPNRQFDVVFIGDSRIYRGISPTIITRELSEIDSFTVFNYGFSSAGLDTVFLDAGAALLNSNSKKQRILVLGVTASSLADENLANQHHWQEKNRHPAEIWQRKYMNSYLSFFDPSSPLVLRNTYRGEKSGYYQKYQKNGWIASDKLPRDDWAGYWHIQNTYPTVKFSRSVRENLIKKVAEWEAEGIQVFGFRPPAAAHFEAIETKYYPEEALTTQFEAVGGTWIEIPNRTTYITYDGNHLEEESAKKLSEVVGKAIKNSLDRKKRPVLLRTALDFETNSPQHWELFQPQFLTKEEAFQGKKAYIVKPQSYSCTYISSLDSFLNQNLYIRTSCWMKTKNKEQRANAVLVFSIQDANEVLLWKGTNLMTQSLNPSKWNQLSVAANYVNNSAGCILKAYVWNKGDTTVVIDELQVEVVQDSKK
ncbi:MAG: hypothetical protein JKY03_14355 [Aureispira sp.]|nr:hypothetical protein [Aureispira sp.]